MEHLLFKNILVINEAATNNFRSGLEKPDFGEILKEYCPNKALYNLFLKITQAEYDKAFPFKRMNILRSQMKKERWMKLHTHKLKNTTERNIDKYKTHNIIYNKLKRLTGIKQINIKTTRKKLGSS
ncbi:hypothetical protein LSH36_634g00024 [Paralvinella palmiformis]|uniref:Uncharacterized protein n=1 Tax=Paralvinella palmiformis TaxID=53620 RepID=A0AAD9J4Q0_9ANNE|nr:hypothetical protein LSH36_634g00024 [Paralvinella palmiformis]